MSSSAYLARTLGMHVTAEGAETAEQFEWVAENCDQAQDYYIGRQMPSQSTRLSGNGSPFNSPSSGLTYRTPSTHVKNLIRARTAALRRELVAKFRTAAV